MVQIWYRFPRAGGEFPVPKGMVHPDRQVFTLSNASSNGPGWQLNYPRLMRGDPYTFLLLSLIIIHCNLMVISAQKPQPWAIPSGSTGPVCARLKRHLGHWTPTRKSCPCCFSRETQGTSITWLCIASLSLQLSFQMWCQ